MTLSELRRHDGRLGARDNPTPPIYNGDGEPVEPVPERWITKWMNPNFGFKPYYTTFWGKCPRGSEDVKYYFDCDAVFWGDIVIQRTMSKDYLEILTDSKGRECIARKM